LQRSASEYKEEVKKISLVEWGHIQKYMVEQIKTIDRLGQLTKRIEKYIHGCLKNNEHSLSMSTDQHKFPYNDKCDELFSQ
jgi:hypothetical protein